MPEIEAAAQRFTVLDHAPIGQFVLRQDFVVLFWNRCLESWTGIPRDRILGTRLLEHFPHLGAPKYARRIESIFSGGPPTIFSSQLHKHLIPARLPGGKLRFQYSVVTAIPAEAVGTFYAMFAIQDVTSLTEAIENHKTALKQAMAEMEERRKAEAELVRYAEELERLNTILKEQSIRDGLTGLFNHRYFYQVLHRDFLLAHRNGADMACVLLDLDYFKGINDTYGHQAGDFVLKETAERIMKMVRRTDMVARYGGEEFAVLLPNTDLTGAGVIAEHIRAQIEGGPFHYGASSIRITASIGLSTREAHLPTTPQELLSFADRALYRAKENGRNRLEIFAAEAAERVG